MYKQGIGEYIAEKLKNNDFSVIKYDGNTIKEVKVIIDNKIYGYFSGSKDMLFITKNDFKIHIGKYISRTPKIILEAFEDIKGDKK